jgi:hypothetical protein
VPGFHVSVAGGRERGVDIEAVSSAEVLLLEAKGSAQNPPQQVNYFLGTLGELLQRMSEPSAAYGLALPDKAQYRRLASRLPPLVWDRLNFTVLCVTAEPLRIWIPMALGSSRPRRGSNRPAGRHIKVVWWLKVPSSVRLCQSV